jgi:single-stranded-DNA-specific exonuclease
MRWTLKPKPETKLVNQLSKELGVDITTGFLLVQRGIETYEEAKSFFRPELKDLHNPFLMKDMDKAVSRIEQAILNQENILIYGDYDVDGTTSVAYYLLIYVPIILILLLIFQIDMEKVMGFPIKELIMLKTIAFH